jgi:hypothetical protein
MRISYSTVVNATTSLKRVFLSQIELGNLFETGQGITEVQTREPSISDFATGIESPNEGSHHGRLSVGTVET